MSRSTSPKQSSRASSYIPTFFQIKNQELALQTILLLNSLVESFATDLRIVKSFRNIEVLLNQYMRPGKEGNEISLGNLVAIMHRLYFRIGQSGPNIQLNIATLAILTQLCADFRFSTKFLALHPIPIPALCAHLKSSSQEMKVTSFFCLSLSL